MATPQRDERGLALSVWLVGAIVGLIVVIGIGIDLSGHARAEQQARHLAHQAARVAGQKVSSKTENGPPAVNLVTARKAATAVLSAESYSGTVTASPSGTITVEITNASYRTRFLNIIGIRKLPIRASGSADPLRTLDGTQR